MRKGAIAIKTQEIIQQVLSKTPNVLKHGTLTPNVLMELKMMTSLYNYIEVITNYYDDEERPDFNNWTDVEGFGYGWRWLRYEEDKWHDMMSKMVSEESDGLLYHINNTYYFVYENERGKTYHFVTNYDTRWDTIIALSNEELYF